MATEKTTRADLIKALNGDLAREYQAVINELAMESKYKMAEVEV